MNEKPSLSQADVNALLTDPSPDGRAGMVGKVAAAISAVGVGTKERLLAEEIFRTVARDTELKVREALGAAVRTLPDLPADVVKKLASDVDSVALPAIEWSELLTDEDLVAIVASNNPQRQVAVARRSHISEVVSKAVVEKGGADAVATLVSNEGAEIAEPSLMQAISRFPTDVNVQTAMVDRPKLPPSVSERLVSVVSDKLREQLATRQELPGALATDLVLEARERAIMSLLAEGESGGDVEEMVHQLHKNGRLTDTLILRACCMGDISFLEAALAVLAGVPMMNAKILVNDPGGLGLNSLCAKAHLPKRLVPALKLAVEVALETDYDGLDNDRARFGRRILERFLTQFEEMGAGLSEEDVSYLMRKLDQFSEQAHAA